MLAEKYQYDGGGSSGGAEAFHIPTILSACNLCKEIVMRENYNCVSRLNEFDKDWKYDLHWNNMKGKNYFFLTIIRYHQMIFKSTYFENNTAKFNME